jgi:hypothetical protein
MANMEDKMTKETYDFPDGWSCCACGDEYNNDYIGEYIKSSDTCGVYCRRCTND